MNTTSQRIGIETSWPPEEGEVVTFSSATGTKTGVLKDIRWGLVWRDFILEDGRVIPEHRVVGCPDPPAWRNADEISQGEREAWEERLVTMAEGGIDPHDREQTFWAELNQYLAYIYLRFKGNNPEVAMEQQKARER
jgi:hypothetical protein